MLIFFSVATAIVAAVHYYIWARLVRDTALPPPWRAIATVAFFVLFLSIPTMFLLRGDRAIRDALKWPVYGWMGFMFILFFLLLATDVARLFVWLGGRFGGDRPPDPERRRALARMVGGAVATLGAGAGASAVASALGRVHVKEVEIPLRRLPATMD